MAQEVNLRGEYWIQDGHVEFADGDVGDRNHEGIATDSIYSQYEDEIVALASEHGVKVDRSYGDYHPEDLTSALDEIEEILRDQGMAEQAADAHMMQEIGCNKEAFDILRGGGDARLYAMKYENWIAVRGHNIELYGYDETKRRYLQNGINEILDNEGVDEDVDPADIEFTMHDLKTNRSSYVSLQDIENPAPTMRTNQALLSVKKVTPSTNAASEENKGQVPTPSVKNKWTAAAQKAGVIGPGQDLWRNTSEGHSFKTWLTSIELKENAK